MAVVEAAAEDEGSWSRKAQSTGQSQVCRPCSLAEVLLTAGLGWS
jgi:hypothetical protein